MRQLKISQLQQKQFTGQDIDNCFFVDKINSNEMSAVPLKSIIDWFIKEAKENGLSVEFKDDRIVFKK